MTSQHLKQKILELLRLPGVLSEESIEKMTTSRAMGAYTIAFTHSSIDPKDNFQSHEFIGDSSINMSVTVYIRQRFPKIVSIGWLTRIKQMLVSTKYFRQLTLKYKLMDVFRISKETYDSMSRKEQDGLLDDVFEAAIGSIYNVASTVFEKGFGHLLVYHIVKAIFDDVHISLEWNKFMDPVSRLKEVYDQAPNKKELRIEWKEGASYKFFNDHNAGTVACAIYYPRFDREHKEHRIVNEFAATQEEALVKAATVALERRRVFGDLLDDYPDPYSYNKKANNRRPLQSRVSQYETVHAPKPVDIPNSQPEDKLRIDLRVPEYLLEFTRNLLTKQGVSDHNISLMTDHLNGVKLTMSCITTCIEPEIQGYHAIALFESISLFDAIASEYAISKHGYTREGILTKEKLDLLSIRNFAKMVPVEFVDVANRLWQDNKAIYIVPGIAEKRMASIFKAYVSELKNIIDSVSSLGVGYRIMSEYITGLFISNASSIERLDAKSKLNLLYITKGWGPISEGRGTMEYSTVKTSEKGAEIETHKHIVKIYGYPTGPKKTLLSTGEGADKISAEQDASKKALISIGALSDKPKPVREDPFRPIQRRPQQQQPRASSRVYDDDYVEDKHQPSKPQPMQRSVRVLM